MEFSSSAFPGAPVRAQDLAYIVDTLRHNQCCAVVGPSNTGKSFLLKSLLEDEVRQACALEDARPPVMVFVDFLRPVDSEPGFYELLLRCASTELRRINAGQPLVDAVRERHGELLRSATPMNARSLFDDALYVLCIENDLRLVFVMDEFDPAFGALPAAPFQELRVLRDDVGERLILVTGTSRHLGRIRSDTGTSEFQELFDLHTRVLQPMSEADSRRLVDYVQGEQGAELPGERRTWAIQLSGGHPGLLERIVHILLDVGERLGASAQEVLAGLMGMWAIQEECRRLWDEIEEEERQGLLTLVGGGRLPAGAQERAALEAKGLIAGQEDGSWDVFSPVFEAFVEQQLEGLRQGPPGGIEYHAESGQILVDGRDISRNLSVEQYSLLAYLCQRPGLICGRDEIAQVVWPDQWEAGITDAQISQLVKRIRTKIEPDPRHPRYLVTARGRGYRLEMHPE
jgi:hypothetical protein